jgi:hypothetical protein
MLTILSSLIQEKHIEKSIELLRGSSVDKMTAENKANPTYVRPKAKI